MNTEVSIKVGDKVKLNVVAIMQQIEQQNRILLLFKKFVEEHEDDVFTVKSASEGIYSLSGVDWVFAKESLIKVRG